MAKYRLKPMVSVQRKEAMLEKMVRALWVSQ